MMNFLNRNSLLFGLVSSVILSSCGALGFKKDSDDVQSPQLVQSDDVMLLAPEDPACMDNGKSVSLSSFQIWQWNGASAVAKTVPLSLRAGSQQQIYSAGVAAALFDAQIERTCDYNAGDVSCKDGKVIQQPRVVKICRSTGSYGRESIESMTLTSQYMAESARSFYMGLTSAKSSILDAQLVIQPREVWHLTNVKSGRKADLMQSDNAAFSMATKSDDPGLFWVYPTAKKSFAKSPLHLWEVPFVMRHEYGHNVFHNHVQTAADSVGLKAYEDGSSLEHIMRNVPTGKSKDLMLAEKTQQQKDLSGLNELFADLFAYYNGDAAADQLKGVVSLDTTRDPSSKYTAGGTKKVWTQSEADIYRGIASAQKTSDSSEPDFTDVHDIATAFGYNMAQLMEASLAGKSSAVKADVLLKWLDALSAHILAKGSAITLDSMTAEMVKVIVANKSGDVATACSAFAANMSGLPISIAACK